MNKKAFKVSVFVVSMDFEGSGADRMCYNDSELDETINEYKEYLKEQKFKGEINIHQYDGSKYPKDIFDDSQIFFDNYFNPCEDIIHTINID